MYTIDIQPFLNSYAVPLGDALAAGLTIWLVSATKNWLDAHAAFLSAQTKEKITDLENQALDKGAAYIINWAQTNGGKFNPQVNSWVLSTAANVALNHAAGVLADNDNSPDDVADRLLAHLPPEYISTDTTGVTIPKPDFVAVSDLAPLKAG